MVAGFIVAILFRWGLKSWLGLFDEDYSAFRLSASNIFNKTATSLGLKIKADAEREHVNVNLSVSVWNETIAKELAPSFSEARPARTS